MQIVEPTRYARAARTTLACGLLSAASGFLGLHLRDPHYSVVALALLGLTLLIALASVQLQLVAVPRKGRWYKLVGVSVSLLGGLMIFLQASI